MLDPLVFQGFMQQCDDIKVDCQLLDLSSKRWCEIRLDQMHPIISGNKLFKLLPFLSLFQQHDYQQIISLGGRHSNHLHALAYLCNQLNIPFTALVRGYPEQAMTPTLTDLQQWHASIYFLSHWQYSQRDDLVRVKEYCAQHGIDINKALFIAEGGSHFIGQNTVNDDAAVQLLRKIVLHSLSEQQLSLSDFDYVSLPVGSGVFLQQALRALSKPILGILALKNHQQMADKFSVDANAEYEVQLLNNSFNLSFGKVNQSLASYLQEFRYKYSHDLDPIYNAKHFFSVTQWMQQNPAARVLSLNTGGLQGARYLQSKLAILMNS
ncbi:MAG: hypothetical protein HRU21_07600 [Pseudomonadales bacterium]|nr:hypothetical protein [Pseudomonadales bacterium]